jgi:hypothetical protein
VPLALLFAVAFAADLQPTLALPSAVPIGAGEGQAGLGALGTGGASPGLAGTLRGAVGITDRLAVNGALELPRGGLLLGLRYNVVATETVRVAPFVFGIATDDLVTLPGTDAADALSAGLGVAVEAGGRTARFDLSLPLVATGIDPLANPLYVPFVGTSVGVTVHVNARSALRVGVESLASPALSYRYVRERWYLQATGLYSVVRGVPMGALEGGLRF